VFVASFVYVTSPRNQTFRRASVSLDRSIKGQDASDKVISCQSAGQPIASALDPHLARG
jgi:hypothetical protein